MLPDGAGVEQGQKNGGVTLDRFLSLESMWIPVIVASLRKVSISNLVAYWCSHLRVVSYLIFLIKVKFMNAKELIINKSIIIKNTLKDPNTHFI